MHAGDIVAQHPTAKGIQHAPNAVACPGRAALHKSINSASTCNIGAQACIVDGWLIMHVICSCLAQVDVDFRSPVKHALSPANAILIPLVCHVMLQNKILLAAWQLLATTS